MNNIKTCSSCFINDQVPGISINKNGQCNVCAHYRSPDGKKQLKNFFQIDRLADLQVIAEELKENARKTGNTFDCILGASGGFDSTYVMYLAKKVLGLNPLIVKYDNGVCHPLANANLIKTCELLDLELRVIKVIDSERKYLSYSTQALENIGVFFSACFSCHYIIASVVFREAIKEGLSVILTSTNQIEKDFAKANHSLMASSLIKGFFSCGPVKMIKFLYYETKALYHFTKLKFQFDKLSLRFLKNLFKLHPEKPHNLRKIDISEYIAWDYKKIETVLREELDWQTPRDTIVPYFRFDCHYSAMIDKSFKKLTGLTEHAMLLNWFAQAGFVTKSEIHDDIQYMNNDDRVEKEVSLIMKEFNIKELGSSGLSVLDMRKE